MKLIEGLKKIKDLQRKIDDLRGKIATNCADIELDTPVYGTPEQQSAQIKEWLQSIHDSVKEILRLRIAIQTTNLQTTVKIELNGKAVEHSIAEWIHRRRDLAFAERNAWASLTDKGLKAQAYNPTGKEGDVELAKVRRYYDPKIKDEKVELFTSEPTTIDAKLEVVNAETDLIE